MKKFLNDQPFEHTSRNGLTFTGERCDLKAGVNVQYPSWKLSVEQIGADFAQFAAWHNGCIWEQLNGFQGYDCVDYTMIPCVEELEERNPWIEP